MRLTDYNLKKIRGQKRFLGLEQFDRPIRLSSPLLHGDEEETLKKALLDNENELVDKAEEAVGSYLNREYVVGVNSATGAMHMALKLAAERLYGSSSGLSTPDRAGRGGSLYGKRVFCPEFTSADIINPVIYEGGEPVFIDAAGGNWGLDPEVLEMAFETYPDVKIVIMSHMYGFPGKVMEVKRNSSAFC